MHDLDFVRSFLGGDESLGQCLSINLSTVLRKVYNDKFEFSSDSVSDSFQLTLFRSSSKAIKLTFLNDFFTSVLLI